MSSGPGKKVVTQIYELKERPERGEVEIREIYQHGCRIIVIEGQRRRP